MAWRRPAHESHESKLKSQKGVTLVEAVAAAGVLAVLALMLHTGLSMAHRSYQQVTSQAESRLLLSTLTDLLTRELRFARDVTLLPDGTLDYYTSISYGRRTVLSLDDQDNCWPMAGGCFPPVLMGMAPARSKITRSPMKTVFSMWNCRCPG